MKLRALLTLCLLTCALKARAQEAPVPLSEQEPSEASTGSTISLAEYQQQLTAMQALVATCRQSPPQCLTTTIPADAQVKAEITFQQRWQWLRLTLQLTQDPKLSNRLTLLESATQRLSAESALALNPTPAPDIKSARTNINSILSQREFRRVQHASYLQRQFALFGLFLDRLFSGISGLIPQSPWFATLLEWALLAAAIIALMLWAWRLNQQQRLAIITHATPPPHGKKSRKTGPHVLSVKPSKPTGAKPCTVFTGPPSSCWKARSYGDKIAPAPLASIFRCSNPAPPAAKPSLRSPASSSASGTASAPPPPPIILKPPICSTGSNPPDAAAAFILKSRP